MPDPELAEFNRARQVMLRAFEIWVQKAPRDAQTAARETYNTMLQIARLADYLASMAERNR